MFDPFSIEDTDLDHAIASAFADLKSFSADEPGYERTVEQLKELYAIRNKMVELNLRSQESAAEQQLDAVKHQLAVDQHQLACDQNAWSEEQDSRPFWKRVDPNTALTVAGNIAIGLAVIKYEQTGVIGTKVMSFMRKI